MVGWVGGTWGGDVDVIFVFIQAFSEEESLGTRRWALARSKRAQIRDNILLLSLGSS